MKRYMKKYLFFILAVLPLLFAACSEEKVDLFSSVDRVYFVQDDKESGSNKFQDDSIYINLKKYGETIEYVDDSLISIPIRILGLVSDVDRPVSVIQANTNIAYDLTKKLWEKTMATEGSDYVIENAYIPANATDGYVKVRLKNSEALKSTADTIVAALYIADNEYFLADYSTLNGLTTTEDKDKTQDNLLYRIFFYSNLNEAPRMWYYTSSYPSSRNLQDLARSGGIPQYLGLYTVEKFQLFLDALSLEASLFEFTDNDYALINNGSTTITATGVRSVFTARFNSIDPMFGRWKVQVQRYLQDNPERWNDFPGDSIQWGLTGKFDYNGVEISASGWGVWKK